VNVLVASALHFVVFIENHEGRRRLNSICEVVGTEGNHVASNEVVSRSATGAVDWPFPLRSATHELLARHGFKRRHMGGVER
jgi:hypothetical protein